jgi:hypothetical protein
MDSDTDDITYIYMGGVFKKDCKQIEKMLEDRLISENDIHDYDEKKGETYEKLPPYFTDLSSWVHTTNLQCWICDRTFNNKPVFIPKSITPTDTGVQIIPEGVFCWFNCAYAYLLVYITNSSLREDRYNMLKYLFNIYNGFLPKSITPAYNKFCQKQYSGSNISRNEYYKILDSQRKKDLLETNKVG